MCAVLCRSRQLEEKRLGYILVPVPTEYVLDVMRWVLFRAPDADELVARDIEQVERFLTDTDDATRSLLRLVASATIKGEPLQLRDLADELGEEPQAVRDAIERLNDEVLEDDDRSLIELRNDVAVGVYGRTGTMAFVSMRLALARTVRSSDGAGDG
jgi:hypothetical protein